MLREYEGPAMRTENGETFDRLWIYATEKYVTFVWWAQLQFVDAASHFSDDAAQQLIEDVLNELRDNGWEID